MKTRKPPFGKKKVALANCELLLLARADALPIAQKICAIEPWSVIRYRPRNLARHLLQKDPLFRCYKIMADGEIAGLVSVKFPWLHGTYLDLLAIFPGHQRKKIGREIMLWMESENRPHHKNLWALVSEFNTGARKFYKKQGFREIAVLNDLVRPGFDEILIRKVIS